MYATPLSFYTGRGLGLARSRVVSAGYARGRGISGLGEADCPQPVSTAERDALRNEIKGWTSPYKGQHFHEGHPDIKAIFIDVQNRLRGLEERPKLLRCSREARDRANRWIAQLNGLRAQASRIGTSSRPGAKATSWIRVDSPFQFTVFRGPTYTVRPGTPHPEAFEDLSTPASNASASAPTPPPITPGGSTPATSAPGSVVINGVVYESSAAANAARGSGEVSTPEPAPGGTADFGGGGGSVAGIPTQYLIYGGLALVAWKMLGK